MKRITAAILCLLFLLTACSKSESLTWQEHYDLGVRYLSEGNYEEAIIAFEAAIGVDPKQADIYLSFAEVYLALGDEEQARAILEEGYDVTGDDAIKNKMHSLGWISSQEVVEWTDPILERMVRDKLNLTSETIVAADLDSITRLVILGNTHVFINEESEEQTWGWAYVNNEAGDEKLYGYYGIHESNGERDIYSERGGIKTIDTLKYFRNLQSVSIVANQITDISILSTMPNVHHANFFANDISDTSLLDKLSGDSPQNQFIKIGDPLEK